MPQSLVLGNGNMLTSFGDDLLMRDFYYPFVGSEEHTSYGNKHMLGFFVEGEFAWLDDKSWKIKVDYHAETLVGNSVARNEKLKIEVQFEDFVYSTHNILFRRLNIENLADKPREIKVFFGHNFYIYGYKLQDTAQYEPDLNAVLHYRRNRYFLLNGAWESGEGMDQYTVGKSGFNNMEGTWRDAEDGFLEGHSIEQGAVDSTVGFSQIFKVGERKKLNFWISVGHNLEEVGKLDNRVRKMGVDLIYDHTKHFWQKWVNKENFDFQNLPKEVVKLFKQSLLLIRTQTDENGAIIASTDTAIMEFNRDTYSYMWPRDGAFVSMALSAAGYEELAENFFHFCKEVITKEGYVLNKYQPDGSVGSCWHSKIKDGEINLPIQEDESALVLVALEKYYRKFRNVEVVQKLFNSLISPIANWMCDYTDEKTSLPLPSYDLWERRRAVHTFTCATVYAGLQAASFLSEATGHFVSAEKFAKKAKRIKKATLKYLYSEEDGRFLRKVILKDGEIIKRDNLVDASISHVWSMGLLPPEDERVRKTMEAINKYLAVPQGIGGIARYEQDDYHFDFDHLDLKKWIGNPWIITTLWRADYIIAMAQSRKDLKEALGVLLWVVDRQSESGILPEQNQPKTNKPLSVAPLTWSHSTFVATVLAYLKKYQELK